MTRRRHRSSSPGFALAEVVVVLVCLGILAAGGVSAWQSISRARAGATVREIVALVEHAKRASRTCRAAFEVVFDQKAQQCGVRRVGSATWYPTPGGAEPLIVRLGTTASGGLLIKKTELPAGSALRFDVEGVPSGSARIDLSDDEDRSYRITVTATGKTSWSRK